MGNLRKDNLVRHHLLEIILWPNEDGTFTEIRNSVQRLKELGIYDDWKMTITITNSEHWTLHHKGKVLSNTTKEKIGKAAKGRVYSPEIRKKFSEASIGKAGTNTGKKFSENWKNNMKQSWAIISKAYKEHKLSGGTLTWIEFLKSHKNTEV